MEAEKAKILNELLLADLGITQYGINEAGDKSNVLTLPSFSNITQDDYRKLLLHLLDIGHIQKTDEDTLIVWLILSNS